MKIEKKMLWRAAGVLAFAAAAYGSRLAAPGSAQIDNPSPSYKWWVDANVHCPAECDAKKYDCPCAKIGE